MNNIKTIILLHTLANKTHVDHVVESYFRIIEVHFLIQFQLM